MRPVTQGDVYRAETEEIPRIFQVGGAFRHRLESAHADARPRTFLGFLHFGFDASLVYSRFNLKGVFHTRDRGR